MKKSKLFAPFLMLLAGAIACIIMYGSHYDTMEMLLILLAVLLIFYAAGYLIQKQVVSFMKQIQEQEEEKAEKEGEVIEKEIPAEESSAEA